jgi:hypothetical protein
VKHQSVEIKIERQHPADEPLPMPSVTTLVRRN